MKKLKEVLKKEKNKVSKSADKKILEPISNLEDRISKHIGLSRRNFGARKIL